MASEEYKKGVAEKICRRLEQLGLQRQEFANLMGVRPSSVTKWLKGDHNFTAKTLFEIERVLNFCIFDYGQRRAPVPEELIDRFLGWV